MSSNPTATDLKNPLCVCSRFSQMMSSAVVLYVAKRDVR
jgi:hypothetical protein